METIRCTWCNSENFRKVGFRKSVDYRKQIYKCNNCKKKFSGKYESIYAEPHKPTERKTYPQNWPAYNTAQCQEKIMFLQILSELTGKIETDRNEVGRPKKEFSDLAFACCLKVYSGFSGRRLTSELELSRSQGYIEELPHFNTVLNTFNQKEITPALQNILRLTSFPLREVESNFAADSTGFSTSMFSRWVDKRFGKDKTERIWVKAHAMCGVKTNVISSIEITEGTAGDSPYFIPLLHSTS